MYASAFVPYGRRDRSSGEASLTSPLLVLLNVLLTFQLAVRGALLAEPGTGHRLCLADLRRLLSASYLLYMLDCK